MSHWILIHPLLTIWGLTGFLLLWVMAAPIAAAVRHQRIVREGEARFEQLRREHLQWVVESEWSKYDQA